jgi:hypothetical protein
MSTAKLNVWVTAVGDASRVDMAHQWYVHVLHPSGDILEWAGTDYRNLLTTNGHREIELPPGEYMVVATWSPAPGGTAPSTLGNHATHVAVVRVNSGDHIGVVLFTPTFHFCSIWWIIALQELQTLKLLPKEATAPAKAALEAAKNLLTYIPADEVTRRMLKIEEKKRNK